MGWWEAREDLDHGGKLGPLVGLPPGLQGCVAPPWRFYYSRSEPVLTAWPDDSFVPFAGR